MHSTHHPKLTSAEIAGLWSQYMNETAGLCINRFLHQHVEDANIRALYDYALRLGEKHVDRIRSFLKTDGFPIPVGFSEQDVNLAAPRLFSDALSLHYLNIMSIHGCHGYSGAVTTSSRKDVREYFTECGVSSMQLCNRTKDVLLSKGLYFRPPSISAPDTPEFVRSQSFVSGWFGDKRPLSCVEITDILFNLKKSILAKAALVAFSQVAQAKQVTDFFMEAIQIKEKHIDMLNKALDDDHLPAPPSLDAEISDSTTPPFSDKLMMFLVGFLFSTAMVYYGSGMASSPRKDLISKYTVAIADDMKVGSDWIRIMTDNRWLEQPPLAENRKALATADRT
ncbi:DUF3231 family protein [Paenibacillus flagellatus]|uniref:DUF3231 family protein n=1 Tax=Paenibacillus flagellatus TaxID=2211139 RepID=UPI0013050A4A|nr:DUF3231 family protein [Paenibacillus flagellatus]